MTSPERRKGNGWENEIVRYLREHGFPFAERAYGAGRPDDRGDIDGIPGWVLEAKAHKSLDLAGWANEAAAEAANARAPWWAVIAKRRNKPVGEAYVVMPLSQFARLLADEPEVIANHSPHGVECPCPEAYRVGRPTNNYFPSDAS